MTLFGRSHTSSAAAAVAASLSLPENGRYLPLPPQLSSRLESVRVLAQSILKSIIFFFFFFATEFEE